MTVEIYTLHHTPEGAQIDRSRRVACINVKKDGSGGTYDIYDRACEKLLHLLFDEDVYVLQSGGVTPEGAHFDGGKKYRAWSREAVEEVVNKRLVSYNLGGVING